MFVIGLTGGIASGKSTVSRLLKELGATILDADVIAREVVEPGQPALAEIAAAFGPEVLREDGSLDRARLGALVFGDGEARARLNAITHPRVIRRINELLEEERRANPRGVAVVDAPLLLEAGMGHLVDEVWVVAADEETQLRRLMRRDGLSRAEAMRRIRAQMPLAEKLRQADRVIDTGCTLEETARQVRSLWNLIAGQGGAGEE